MEQRSGYVLAGEQASEKNEWLVDLAKTISRACAGNRRGFAFIHFPYAVDMGDTDCPRSCLLTDLAPTEFMAAISGAIVNYCRFRKDLHSNIEAGTSFMDGSEMAEHVLKNIKRSEGAKDE